MYHLTVTRRFAAAHQLRGYQGQCAHLHGHTWRVEVTVTGTRLNENGMLLDFRDLKNHLNQVIKDLDHQFLNELTPFNRINPTAENLAGYIYERVHTALAPELKLSAVKVWESPDACACYVGE